MVDHPGILKALMNPEGEKDFSAILMMLVKNNKKVSKALAKQLLESLNTRKIPQLEVALARISVFLTLDDSLKAHRRE